jgi:periplasmic protein CpxP/Spy
MNDLVYGYCLAKRTLLLASMLLVSVCAVWAQSEAPPAAPVHGRGFGPERELQQLTHVLSLSADQQTQVKALLTEQQQKMEALRNSSSNADASGQGTPSRHEQMEAIHNDTDTKITALLNDDQKTKFAQLQAQRKARMEQHQGGGDNPPAPQPNN